MKGLVSGLFIVFILLMAIAIGSQNDTDITVNFLIAKATIKISTFIAVALGSGVMVGVLIMLPLYAHTKFQLILLKQKNRQNPSKS